VARILNRARNRVPRRSTPAGPDTAYSPDVDERLAEIAEILAAGLMRLRARKSSQISGDYAEFFLDFRQRQSGPDGPTCRNLTHETHAGLRSQEDGLLRACGNGEGG
jgi:hypothetical protein